MSKVLIMSDSHGLRNEIDTIKARHQLTHMIHCGDSELSAKDPVFTNMIKVKGNCDFGNDFVNNQTVDIEGLRFFITHGHLYDVRESLSTLSYQAAEVEARIVCFGHTHIAVAEKINNQLFINPGSIRLPRNRREKSYAILSFESLEKVQVDFYTPAGKQIKDLTYSTNLQ